MSYATPEAFKNALEARIRKVATERGQPIPRVRQLIVFDRFLARVFDVFGERAIVKGGAALELRLDRARTTRDIDLRMSGSSEQLSNVLYGWLRNRNTSTIQGLSDVLPAHHDVLVPSTWAKRRVKAPLIAGGPAMDRTGPVTKPLNLEVAMNVGEPREHDCRATHRRLDR